MGYGKKRDPFYATATWQRLRLMVLQRDHYQCQICHHHAADTVHHVAPREERPDLAYSLDNLESVCRKCHNQAHPEKGGGEAHGKRKEETRMDGVRVIELK